MIITSASRAASTHHSIIKNGLINSRTEHLNPPRIFMRNKTSFDPLAANDGKRYSDSVARPVQLLVMEQPIKPIAEEAAIKVTKSFSKIIPPAEPVFIKKSQLPTIADCTNCFGTGSARFPNQVVFGRDRLSEGKSTVQKKLPGDGIFTNVLKGEYDIRPLKYLFLINQEGLHLDREMAESLSNRGIVSHIKLATVGSVGGEIWFLPEEKAVHFNLSSGRFPSKNDSDLEAVAKYLLSIGYEKVYATPRHQRYGEITPILYMVDSSSV